MVRDTLNPNFRDASCCSVEVVNGAAGFLVEGFVSMEDTVWVAPWQAVRNAWASSSVLNVLLQVALTADLPVPKWPTTRKVDSAVWASISRSRSTMMRTPTLCTRPALSLGLTLRHKTGLRSNPTRRSKMRLACCAFTKSMST